MNNPKWRYGLGAAVGLLMGVGLGAAWRVQADPPSRDRHALQSLGLLPERPQTAKQLTASVAKALLRMQTIQTGNTRGDLLKVFTTEGGLSTGLQRTYVYRECPYIKVDVKFEPVGKPERDQDGRVTLGEDPRDVITKISKPYLNWTIID